MIEELRLRNFEGFQSARVRFTEGLNLITGRNSAGKTALLEALVYALYGVVSGVESRMLVSRVSGVREMEVYLRFRSPKNGSRVEVYRAAELRKGRFSSRLSRLLVDGKEVQVEGLEDLRRRITLLLGVGYRQFSWVVYARQGRLTEILEPRRSDMDAVLEITLLRELDQQLDQARRSLLKVDGRDVSTEHHSIVSQLLPLQEKRLKELREEVEELREEVENLEQRLEETPTPALERLMAKVKEYERVKAMQAGSERSLRELLSRYEIKDLEEARRRGERLRLEVLELEDEVRALERELEDARREEAEKRGELENLRKHHRTHLELLASNASRCPTCGQPITPEKMEPLIEGEEREIQLLEEEVSEVKAKRAGIEQELQRLRRKLEDARRRRERIRSLLESVEQYSSTLEERERVLKSLRIEVEGLLRSLGVEYSADEPGLFEKLSQRFPSPEQRRELERRLKELQRRLEERLKASEALEKEVEGLRSRVRELELRLKAGELAERLRDRLGEVIEGRREKLLRAIALKAAGIFRSLTDQRLYTGIRIDPETYRVYVTPRGVSGELPATRVGGGHQTLIALSLRLALLSRLGLTGLLILDEPTYGVDEENLQLLLNQLTRITRHIRQAIIVTHHGRGLEEADNIIEVYKDPDGYSRVRGAA